MPKKGPAKHKPNGKRMQWFNTVDWDAWKSEFFDSENEDGTYVYRNIYEFSREKAKNIPSNQYTTTEIGVLIRDAIGPRTKQLVPYQGDWFLMREERRVVRRRDTNALVDVIQKEVEASVIGKAVSSTYLRYQAIIDQIIEELLQSQGGRIFKLPPTFDNVADEQSWRKQERLRYQFFHKALEDMLNLKIKIDDQILHTCGFDSPSVMNFIKVGQNDTQKVNDPTFLNSHEVKGQILATAMSAFMEKSAKYKLPLPPDLEKVKQDFEDLEAKANSAKKVN